MTVSGTVVGWAVILAVSSATVAAVVNSAVGDYQDRQGQTYGATSNSASVSIAAVAAAMVSPKQASVDKVADAVTGGTVATKTFTISNDSNISDAYIISAVSASAGSIQGVAFTPAGAVPVAAAVGSTVSPVVPRGGSIAVTVAVLTSGVDIGTNIAVSLTAKTSAVSVNGPQSDTGTAWVFVARGAMIAGVPLPASGTNAIEAPTNGGTATLPVRDLVNGSPVAQAQPGAALDLDLPFTNMGDAPAFNVVVTDHIPPQLHPIAGTVKLQSTIHRTGKSSESSADARVSLQGNTVTATIPRLDAGVDSAITFQATVDGAVPIGKTIYNPADITAQSLASISAVPAVVFVGAMNIVYDGLGGAARPIAGASVSLIDAASGLPAKLASTGTSPNQTDANPFTSGASGAFGFSLAAATGRATDSDLCITAAGYLNRKIKVAVVMGPDGLPTTTLTALDGLPLAIAGGFTLTSEPVTVAGVTGFLGNVPLFSPQTLKLSMVVDRSVASAGDRLEYGIDFGPGNRPLSASAELSVTLPPGVAYAHGTARLAAAPVEPTAAGRTVSWALKDLAASRRLTFDAVVLPSAPENSTLKTQANLAAALPGASLGVDASVDVAVVGGPLSPRSVLTGRVFADRARDGHFAPGDAGLSGVRIFLEDGESVTTDHDGRFSFPAARPGMHVLHLDPSTLPAGMVPYHGFAANDPRSSVRLVHGIFDSGLMADMNFAVSESAVH